MPMTSGMWSLHADVTTVAMVARNNARENLALRGSLTFYVRLAANLSFCEIYRWVRIWVKVDNGHSAIAARRKP